MKQILETSFISLAEYLYRIKNENLWEDVYSSWDEFRDDIKLSDATISKLMSLYSKFILEYGFTHKQLVDAGGWSVLSEALPVIHSKKDAEHWLGEAQHLSLRDMRTSIREARRGVEMASCKHDNTYIIKICSDCGDRQRIYDETVE